MQRSPDTVFLLAAFAIMGSLLALAGYVPRSVEAITPVWGGVLWGAVLAGSSTLALIGVLWRDQATGWVLEAAGRPGIAATCIGYAVALTGAMGDNYGASIGVALFGGIGVASVVRTVQLIRSLRELRWILNQVGPS